MLYYIIKLFLTSLIILIITEASKKSNFVATIFAALPTISILSFIWIYFEQKNTNKIADLSSSIFWMVLPSLPLFLIFPVLLKKGLNFYLSLLISCAITVLFYILFLSFLKKLGVKI
ncbi:MAG: DUF3147 family protein [Exilispira sp.]